MTTTLHKPRVSTATIAEARMAAKDRLQRTAAFYVRLDKQEAVERVAASVGMTAKRRPRT